LRGKAVELGLLTVRFFLIAPQLLGARRIAARAVDRGELGFERWQIWLCACWPGEGEARRGRAQGCAARNSTNDNCAAIPIAAERSPAAQRAKSLHPARNIIRSLAGFAAVSVARAAGRSRQRCRKCESKRVAILLLHAAPAR